MKYQKTCSVLFLRTISQFVIAGGIFLAVASTAQAAPALQITEIMYNPAGDNTGREWIEVRNVGSEAVDLGAKDVRVADAHGKHLIKVASGSALLGPGTIAIIANNTDKFQTDYPKYSGTLLKSAFSLTSTSNDISIVSTNSAGTVLAEATYFPDAGGKNDGNSLQLSKGSFVAGAPTPGTYPAPPPAPLTLRVPTKPSTTPKGSTSRGASANQQKAAVLTDTAYDPGITAPTTAANAPVVGALLAFFTNADSLLASPWFSAYLALLAFSAFSLILVTKRHA